MKIPWDNVKPNWLPYIAVEDVMAIVSKAKNWEAGFWWSLIKRFVKAASQSLQTHPGLYLQYNNSEIFGLVEKL